jgi:hypothetical protein
MIQGNLGKAVGAQGIICRCGMKTAAEDAIPGEDEVEKTREKFPEHVRIITTL